MLVKRSINASGNLWKSMEISLNCKFCSSLGHGPFSSIFQYFWLCRFRKPKRQAAAALPAVRHHHPQAAACQSSPVWPTFGHDMWMIHVCHTPTPKKKKRQNKVFLKVSVEKHGKTVNATPIIHWRSRNCEALPRLRGPGSERVYAMWFVALLEKMLVLEGMLGWISNLKRMEYRWLSEWEMCCYVSWTSALRWTQLRSLSKSTRLSPLVQSGGRWTLTERKWLVTRFRACTDAAGRGPTPVDWNSWSGSKLWNHRTTPIYFRLLWLSLVYIYTV